MLTGNYMRDMTPQQKEIFYGRSVASRRRKAALRKIEEAQKQLEAAEAELARLRNH